MNYPIAQQIKKCVLPTSFPKYYFPLVFFFRQIFVDEKKGEQQFHCCYVFFLFFDIFLVIEE